MRYGPDNGGYNCYAAVITTKSHLLCFRSAVLLITVGTLWDGGMVGRGEPAAARLPARHLPHTSHQVGRESYSMSDVQLNVQST